MYLSPSLCNVDFGVFYSTNSLQFCLSTLLPLCNPTVINCVIVYEHAKKKDDAFKSLDAFGYYFQNLRFNEYQFNVSLFVILRVEVSGKECCAYKVETNLIPWCSILVGSFYISFYHLMQLGQLKAKVGSGVPLRLFVVVFIYPPVAIQGIFLTFVKMVLK